MSGTCKFGHIVLTGENVCTEDHPLATSLKCKLPGCSFSTDPVDKKYVKIAIRQLKSHLKECHSDQEYKENQTNRSTCPICYRIFISKSNVKRHINQEHKQKGRHVCNICNKSFSSKTALIYHSKKHQEKEDKNNKKDVKKKFESKYLKVYHKCNDCELKSVI